MSLRFWFKSVCALVVALVASCASSPPNNQNDICEIFDEKGGWYKDAKKASKRWGVPIAVNMAFIYQESRFDARAKPPRTKILWVIPGPRKSDAFGYPQAKDDTWDWYREKTGRWSADRDEFDDAIDFIAWYNAVSVKSAGIAPNDAYRLYLAYHEGHGGYKRGTYKKKNWLLKTARQVGQKAQTYAAQLSKCEDRLDSWWPF